ncbi:hypothetical protein EJ377_10370 [Chryseobacterium arthrosphaerae]|uniref:Uncharacterized protein n=1 Tax=Chryseobacterium arthrosphaerae TaxID=651561 RepID=A0A3S0QX38_9FLAO|nr:hypothetical protein EJ377_10370 [Chryseobacterium arthrosphaerae]
MSERISQLYIENSKSSNEFTNSNTILQIGQAYWNYYLAYKRVEIYKQNEGRVRNVLDVTKELIKADKSRPEIWPGECRPCESGKADSFGRTKFV